MKNFLLFLVVLLAVIVLLLGHSFTGTHILFNNDGPLGAQVHMTYGTREYTTYCRVFAGFIVFCNAVIIYTIATLPTPPEDKYNGTTHNQSRQKVHPKRS